VRRAFRVNTALLQTVCQLGKLLGYVLRNPHLCSLRTEQVRVGEHRSQNFQRRVRTISGWGCSEEIIQREAVNQWTCSRNVCVNLETLLIARHQQGRVFQIALLTHKQRIYRAQTLALAFVLPSEKTTLPYVGKTLAVFQLGDMLLKCELIARLVCRRWMRLP